MSETVFNVSIPNPHQQYLHVEILISDLAEETLLYLPSWRPGRYEEANFSKQIKAFKAYNENMHLGFQGVRFYGFWVEGFRSASEASPVEGLGSRAGERSEPRLRSAREASRPSLGFRV